MASSGSQSEVPMSPFQKARQRFSDSEKIAEGVATEKVVLREPPQATPSPPPTAPADIAPPEGLVPVPTAQSTSKPPSDTSEASDIKAEPQPQTQPMAETESTASSPPVVVAPLAIKPVTQDKPEAVPVVESSSEDEEDDLLDQSIDIPSPIVIETPSAQSAGPTPELPRKTTTEIDAAFTPPRQSREDARLRMASVSLTASATVPTQRTEEMDEFLARLRAKQFAEPTVPPVEPIKGWLASSVCTIFSIHWPGILTDLLCGFPKKTVEDLSRSLFIF